MRHYVHLRLWAISSRLHAAYVIKASDRENDADIAAKDKASGERGQSTVLQLARSNVVDSVLDVRVILVTDWYTIITKTQEQSRRRAKRLSERSATVLQAPSTQIERKDIGTPALEAGLRRAEESCASRLKLYKNRQDIQ